MTVFLWILAVTVGCFTLAWWFVGGDGLYWDWGDEEDWDVGTTLSAHRRNHEVNPND